MEYFPSIGGGVNYILSGVIENILVQTRQQSNPIQFTQINSSGQSIFEANNHHLLTKGVSRQDFDLRLYKRKLI
jgi:hypothetical protein